MNLADTFDVYERLPFNGYIDLTTGRQQRFMSLGHFVFCSRFAQVDPEYGRYLLNLADPELFMLEVEAVGYTGPGEEQWHAAKMRVINAGIFMQALSNRERYAALVRNLEALTVVESVISDDVTNGLSLFVQGLNAAATSLKVAFFGDCDSQAYIDECMGVIFSKRYPTCLMALDDDSCSVGVSEYARLTFTPFALLSSSLSAEALTENVERRCTHVFRFEGGHMSELASSVLDRLSAQGKPARSIHPKP